MIMDSRLRGKHIEQKILPYIADIESTIDQSHFISKISRMSGIKEDILATEVRKIKSKGLISRGNELPTPSSVPARSRRDAIERILVKEDMERRADKLIAKGKERGFVTYDEILKEFPTIEDDIVFLEELYENFLRRRRCP
jgi:hypothetical protein